MSGLLSRSAKTTGQFTFRNGRVQVTQVQPIEEVEAKDSDVENQHVRQSNELYIAMRPLFLCMTFSGTFDHWKIQRGRHSCKTSISKYLFCYRIFIFVLFVVNFIRYFPTYMEIKSFGPDLLTKLMVHFWYILCILNALACYKMVEDPDRVTKLLQIMGKYQDRLEISEKKTICNSIGKITNASLGLGWFFNIGNVVFAGYMLFQSTIFDNFIAPFTNQNSMSVLIKAVYLLMHLLLSCTWIFTCIATMIFSLTLYHFLKRFTHKIEKLKTTSAPEVQIKLESYRKQHNALCEMIDVADDTFSLYVASSLTISVSLALMLMYNICWYQSIRSDVGQLISHIFWLMAVISNLSVVTITTSLINHWAHAPLQTLYNFDLIDVSTDFSIQMNVFLQRLNGTPIGLSAYKLVLMDRHTCIQIGGLLATYFVVLLQFQQ
ncbi:uncharacterized protein [Argopecten irradians]|uniref:uncharacterized protein n=1 Tax=Argopecten irradians TaxID=31199 RepID=UPI0037210543